MKEGGYLKARDHTIRHVQAAPQAALAGLANVSRQRKEIEKRRRTEETAFNRVSAVLGDYFRGFELG